MFFPVSLDIETSTSEKEKGVVLSVGMVDFRSGNESYWQITHDIYPIKPESMVVNKIDLLSWVGLGQADTEPHIQAYLEGLRDYHGSRYLIPMGLNIAGFDMTYLRYHFQPETLSLLGYRSIDLNALIFREADVREETFQDTKNKLRRVGNEMTKKFLGDRELEQHHALYDAYFNCFVYSLLTDKVPPWMGIR